MMNRCFVVVLLLSKSIQNDHSFVVNKKKYTPTCNTHTREKDAWSPKQRTKVLYSESDLSLQNRDYYTLFEYDYKDSFFRLPSCLFMELLKEKKLPKDFKIPDLIWIDETKNTFNMLYPYIGTPISSFDSSILTEGQIIQFGIEWIQQLSQLHKMNIVHNDISENNLLIFPHPDRNGDTHMKGVLGPSMHAAYTIDGVLYFNGGDKKNLFHLIDSQPPSSEGHQGHLSFQDFSLAHTPVFAHHHDVKKIISSLIYLCSEVSAPSYQNEMSSPTQLTDITSPLYDTSTSQSGRNNSSSLSNGSTMAQKLPSRYDSSSSISYSLPSVRSNSHNKSRGGPGNSASSVLGKYYSFTGRHTNLSILGKKKFNAHTFDSSLPDNHLSPLRLNDQADESLTAITSPYHLRIKQKRPAKIPSESFHQMLPNSLSSPNSNTPDSLSLRSASSIKKKENTSSSLDLNGSLVSGDIKINLSPSGRTHKARYNPFVVEGVCYHRNEADIPSLDFILKNSFLNFELPKCPSLPLQNLFKKVLHTQPQGDNYIQDIENELLDIYFSHSSSEDGMAMPSDPSTSPLASFPNSPIERVDTPLYSPSSSDGTNSVSSLENILASNNIYGRRGSLLGNGYGNSWTTSSSSSESSSVDEAMTSSNVESSDSSKEEAISLSRYIKDGGVDNQEKQSTQTLESPQVKTSEDEKGKGESNRKRRFDFDDELIEKSRVQLRDNTKSTIRISKGEMIEREYKEGKAERKRDNKFQRLVKVLGMREGEGKIMEYSLDQARRSVKQYFSPSVMPWKIIAKRKTEEEDALWNFVFLKELSKYGEILKKDLHHVLIQETTPSAIHTYIRVAFNTVSLLLLHSPNSTDSGVAFLLGTEREFVPQYKSGTERDSAHQSKSKSRTQSKERSAGGKRTLRHTEAKRSGESSELDWDLSSRQNTLKTKKGIEKLILNKENKDYNASVAKIYYIALYMSAIIKGELAGVTVIEQDSGFLSLTRFSIHQIVSYTLSLLQNLLNPISSMVTTFTHPQTINDSIQSFLIRFILLSHSLLRENSSLLNHQKEKVLWKQQDALTLAKAQLLVLRKQFASETPEKNKLQVGEGLKKAESKEQSRADKRKNYQKFSHFISNYFILKRAIYRGAKTVSTASDALTTATFLSKEEILEILSKEAKKDFSSENLPKELELEKENKLMNENPDENINEEGVLEGSDFDIEETDAEDYSSPHIVIKALTATYSTLLNKTLPSLGAVNTIAREEIRIEEESEQFVGFVLHEGDMESLVISIDQITKKLYKMHQAILFYERFYQQKPETIFLPASFIQEASLTIPSNKKSSSKKEVQSYILYHLKTLKDQMEILSLALVNILTNIAF